MVLVEKNSVVVLTSSVTPTSGMLSVLAFEFNVRKRGAVENFEHRMMLTNTAMSHLDMSALLACFVETSRHVDDLVGKTEGG